ncbi:MAG: hypothetical protein Kow0047_02060 [Anaerolineae bacterium]
MSDRSWKEQLNRTLRQCRADAGAHGGRVAVVGVGNELNGDDAAGPLVARRLSEMRLASGELLVVDAGPAPEAYTGLLRRFRPAVVVLVDAAHMGRPPGDVQWIPWDHVAGLSASTHTVSLRLLAEFLSAELGCRVGLLGVQPASTAPGDPVSAPVRAAVEAVAEAIAACWREVPG